jgi:hypothetical protein
MNVFHRTVVISIAVISGLALVASLFFVDHMPQLNAPASAAVTQRPRERSSTTTATTTIAAQRPRPSTSPSQTEVMDHLGGSSTSVTSSVNKTSQLAADLSMVKPQFINNQGDGNILLPIRDDIRSLLNDQTYFLVAVGKRYVVATSESEQGIDTEIIDSQSLRSTGISGWLQFKTGNTAVYVSAQDICTYTIDTPSCTETPGAKLEGDEVYGDDQMLAGFFQPQDETHTNTSLTIAILRWDSTESHLVKVRDVTFTLP